MTKRAGSGSRAGSVILGTDPMIQIHLKMSRIRNTGKNRDHVRDQQSFQVSRELKLALVSHPSKRSSKAKNAIKVFSQSDFVVQRLHILLDTDRHWAKQLEPDKDRQHCILALFWIRRDPVCVRLCSWKQLIRIQWEYVKQNPYYEFLTKMLCSKTIKQKTFSQELSQVIEHWRLFLKP